MRLESRITLRVPARARVWVVGYAERKGFSEAQVWRRLLDAGMRELDVPAVMEPTPLPRQDLGQFVEMLYQPSEVVAHVQSQPTNVQMLQAAIDDWQPKVELVPARPSQQDFDRVQIEPAVLLYRGKPLPLGYTLDRHGRPAWNGPVDADGNPLIED